MSVSPNQRYVVRLYLDDELDPQVYECVKHIWWQSGWTVLTLLHYDADGSHRYVSWLREHVRHYTVMVEA